MRRLSIRAKVLVIAFGINAVCTGVYTTNAYIQQRAEILRGIDGVLRAGAHALPGLLPDGFHDRIDGPESLPAHEYRAILLELSDFARATGLQYLYSYVPAGSNFVIASTSATDEELAAGTEGGFYQVYEQPPPALLAAWENDSPRTVEYRDEWGAFRSLFLPLTSPGGTRYLVGADVDTGFIRGQLRERLVRDLGVGLLIFLAVGAVSIPAVNRIVRPVQRLTRFTRRMADQDFRLEAAQQEDLARIMRQHKDEVGQLARAFSAMEQQLAQYLENLRITTAAKERMESELKIAGDIQKSFLPGIRSPGELADGVDLFAEIQPAKQVGGDLYDFFQIDEEHLCVAVGDVSDKGMPAALFMAVTLTLLRTLGTRGLEPDRILTQLNQALCQNNEAGQFVTLLVGILDTRTGKFTCSHGGHNFPLLRRRDGQLEEIQPPTGLVVGALEGIEYELHTLHLQPGETLFLFSDGIPEAAGPREGFYGNDRLQETLQSLDPAASARETVEAVLQDLARFTGDTPPSDDITAFALRRPGERAAATKKPGQR